MINADWFFFIAGSDPLFLKTKICGPLISKTLFDTSTGDIQHMLLDLMSTANCPLIFIRVLAIIVCY
jgi:hypothetical protein